MKFKMNNRDWEIIELSQEEMRKTFSKWDGEPKEGRYFGLTFLDNDKIYIDSDLSVGQKRQTLLHELMHCYLGCYVDNTTREHDEEALCNLSANSHDIIHKIVEDYFKRS